MEALFKKYFWVLNLVVLAIVAWILAQTVTDYFAMKYLSGSAIDADVSQTAQHKSPMKKAEASRLAANLTGRSPLNVDDKPEPVTDKPPDDCKPSCEDKECGPDGCTGECGKCEEPKTCNADGKCETVQDKPEQSELNIELVGTMSSPADPEIRFANIIADGAGTSMVAIGTELLEGKAKVIDIQPKIIYLREGDKLTHVALWSKKKAAKAPKKGPRISSAGRLKRPPPTVGRRPNPMPANRARNTFDYSTGVKKTGDFQYRIDKQMLDEQLTDLTQLGMQARVIPNYRKGKYEGFKLVGVRPKSLYRAIGIRSGDIIRSINGKAINSPNKAMELFTQLKNSSGINLEVERRGKIESFQYAIQ